MPDKYLQDFRSIITPVIGCVQVQENFSSGLQVSSQIVKKKIPFRCTPTPGIFLATLERGREGGDEIEFASEIGQRLEGSDPMHPAFDLEKLDQTIEYRQTGNIEPESIMTEVPGDKEKKAAAATEVEDLLRWRSIQIQVLGAFDIDLQPFLHLKVLGVMAPKGRSVRRRRGELGLQRLQSIRIDFRQQGSDRDRVKGAPELPPGTPIS